MMNNVWNPLPVLRTRAQSEMVVSLVLPVLRSRDNFKILSLIPTGTELKHFVPLAWGAGVNYI